jgi:hypothetical protein
MGGRTYFGSSSHSNCMFVKAKAGPMKIRPLRFSPTYMYKILTFKFTDTDQPINRMSGPALPAI